jgi:plastocyanin
MKIDRIQLITTAVIFSATLYLQPTETFARQHLRSAYAPYPYNPQPNFYRPVQRVESQWSQYQGIPVQAYSGNRQPKQNYKQPKFNYSVPQMNYQNPYGYGRYGYQGSQNKVARVKPNKPKKPVTRHSDRQNHVPYQAMNWYPANYVYSYYVPTWQAYPAVYSAPVEKKQKTVVAQKKYKPVLKQVKITELGFLPSQLTIRAGDRVLWANVDSVTHQVNGNGGWKSKVLTRGATYVREFSKPGVYSYIGSLSPEMSGEVIVK